MTKYQNHPFHLVTPSPWPIRDILREATYQGCHSIYVIKGIKIGMILFIVSEVEYTE
ncbi:cytochrome c oxidase subunit 3-like [Mycetomoellerius zeteki]|uniref:cytochrome c oxidase subunit 3-like n=1 Tax=Mycetomoellerius zeteki TaxID=64791 RepID=UPI00084E5893|nr:PREDICTED: cytochrome c oxidase subunit 3-like [Trachymyrmex zeteki]